MAQKDTQQVFEKKGQGIYARYIKKRNGFYTFADCIGHTVSIAAITYDNRNGCNEGESFFAQERPGKDEKIFKLIKFRTMTNQKGKDGKLLPDEQRLMGYGKFLRRTSLDELPELINILAGQLSICGPRPLLPVYLSRYNDFQKHRHDVRPGLTGYAQVHGRNGISWEEKFEMDVWYINHISFWGDLKIIFQTVRTVLKHEGISSETSATMEEFIGIQDEK